MLEYKYDVPNVIKTFPWDTKFHALAEADF